MFRILLTVIFLCLSWSTWAQKNEGNLSSDDYYRLAKIEANQRHNYSKGVYYCKKALALSPEYFDVRVLLGKCYLELKMYDSSRYELKKVNDKYPRNVDAKHYLINVECSTHRLSSAICYINELLEIKPYDKALWLKKIGIYNEMGNKVEVKKSITRLYNIFPNDSSVARAYRGYMEEEASLYFKKGQYERSKPLLQQSLDDNPYNLQAIQKLVNAHLNTGKKLEALNTIEMGLAHYPTDPILIQKKIGILQEMGNYQDAISFCEALLKKYPSANVRNTLNELKIESARYYNNSDPYTLYQKVYDANPGNDEAFTFLLNNALSKGFYTDAEELIQTKLKRNSGDKPTLMKQLTLYELTNRQEDADRLVRKLAQKFSGDAEIREKYASILFRDAKGFFQDQLYTQAQPLFEKLLGYADYRSSANEYLYAMDVAQKNYPQALTKINSLIAANGGNEEYIFKKASLLEEMGNLEEARALTSQLTQKNPTNTKFKESYVSQSTPYIKQLIENEKYDSALNAIDRLLDHDPSNQTAYTYAININAQTKQYDKGIGYCNRASAVYPANKEFKLKKADLYYSKGDLNNSISVLKELHQMYPYNEKIESNLAEQYFLKGKKMENDFYLDSATYYFREALALNPADTFSIYRLTNIAIENEQYDSALVYAQQGLQRYPANAQLMYKKGVIYEQMERFDSAYYYVKLADGGSANSSDRYENYMNYLLSKMYKNRAGVYYTRSYFDSIQPRLSLATFEYQRLQPINTYIYRFHYAARPLGTGIQQELEWYHKLTKQKAYTQFNFAFSNRKVFPIIKTSVSYFKSMRYDWEAEVGGRYVLQQDAQSALALIGGIAKSWEEIWLNARVFVISDFSKVYQSLLLQSRYYFNYKNDYITMMGSLGTPPEDRTLDFQLNSFLNYTTRMVGAGIVHVVKHRSTIGLQGNWYNYQIKENYSFNQYNVFITLLTKF